MDGDSNRIGILASGHGTTFEAVRKAELAGVMKAKIGFVICNNPPNKAGIWERAMKLGLADHIYKINNLNFPDKKEPLKGAITTAAATEMLRLAGEYDAKMLVALGFMKRLVRPIIGGLPIANIHPGPLPATSATHGEGSSIKAIELGLTHAGPTFHFMSEEEDENGLAIYDAGKIIWHEPIKITADHRREYETAGRATKLFADVQQAEKAGIGKWIDLALSNITGC